MPNSHEGDAGSCSCVVLAPTTISLARDGEADHLHLLIKYPPKHSLSVLVNAFKGTSSYSCAKERPDIARRYWRVTLWPPSYFAASTGGATLAVIRQYVEQQRACPRHEREGFRRGESR